MTDNNEDQYISYLMRDHEEQHKFKFCDLVEFKNGCRGVVVSFSQIKDNSGYKVFFAFGVSGYFLETTITLVEKPDNELAKKQAGCIGDNKRHYIYL